MLCAGQKCSRGGAGRARGTAADAAAVDRCSGSDRCSVCHCGRPAESLPGMTHMPSLIDEQTCTVLSGYCECLADLEEGQQAQRPFVQQRGLLAILIEAGPPAFIAGSYAAGNIHGICHFHKCLQTAWFQSAVLCDLAGGCGKDADEATGSWRAAADG